MNVHEAQTYAAIISLDQKTKFPTCPVCQNLKFPHISYTYLAEDRAEFHEKERNV